MTATATPQKVTFKPHPMNVMRDAPGRWYGHCTSCPIETQHYSTREMLTAHGPADHERMHRLGVGGTFVK